MPDDSIFQPHDSLFKQAFSRRETALAFFQSYLPETMVKAIDWTTLKLAAGSFVDQAFRHLHSDLLYEVLLNKDPLGLYVLFEHQSRSERWMALRVGGYLHGIWDRDVRDGRCEAGLLPIYPVVVSHAPGGWKAPLHFGELVRKPEDAEIAATLAKVTPEFCYQVIDLARMNENEIRGDLVGRLAIGALKAFADGRLEEWFKKDLPLLSELLRQPDLAGMFRTILKYVCHVDSKIPPQNFLAILETAPDSQTKEQGMSIAEQLIARGREEGLEKGLEKGLERGCAVGTLIGRIQQCQELLGYPVGSISELSQKPLPELEALAAELRARLAASRP